MRALTYIEIDLPAFVEASPEEIVTYRFTYPTDYLPADIEAIPSMVSIGYTPGTISLGSNLGTRASLSVQLADHRHIFDGEPFSQGTFFGKWRARYGTRLQGRPLRWIQGLEGQALAAMETRHFIIESSDGPTPQGAYTIVAKDVLKLADGDRAQAPFPSKGFLVGAIDADDTAAVLSPAGIGNAEYPASGHIAIGGEEICAFTRSGDNLTLTRAQLGTLSAEHDAGSRAQLVLRYVGEDPADIIHDLLTTYAGVDPDYVPLTAWQTETLSYLQQNYSANIAEPTSVNQLISELIEQAALAIWWEPLSQLIRLQVLRAIPTQAASYTEENTLEGSLSIKEQPGTRVSQVFTYFGLRNPLEPIDEENNYRSSALTIDAEAELAYGVSAIKKVYSRWIPFGARSVALRLNDLILGRYRDPPRRFNFSLFRYNNDVQPELGGGYRLEAWPLQTVEGLPADAPIQVTRLNPLSDRYEIEADEMLFENVDPADLVNRVITIDAAIQNINLREIHDSIFPDPDAGASPAESVRFIIEANVIVGSISTSLFSLTVGDWPVGYPVILDIYGRVQGAGGAGGKGSDGSGGPTSDGQPGNPGGHAFYTRFAVTVNIFDGGGIWGGGGGGGGQNRQNQNGNLSGWGGGGGAGSTPGVAGASSATATSSNTPPGNGTTEAGGAAGVLIGTQGGFFQQSGAGGNPGLPGGSGDGTGGESDTAGGAAGRAIDGVSFVTLNDTSPSGLRGATVN
jgi:hypothetical protein